MIKIAQNGEALVGNTPLMRMCRLEVLLGIQACLYGKVEYFNPSGSVKDRAAKAMLDAAQKAGQLTKGGVVIEPTSGNTGIGLASIGAQRGYRVILTMPDTMTDERKAMLRAYGAELVLTPGANGMKGAIEKAQQLHEETPNSFMPNQFENPANPAAHELTTGPEIYRDTDGAVDIFVAGVGTGGTISGVGRYLKKKKPSIQMVAVEPKASAVLSGNSAGPHKIQGIGAGFVPENYDPTVVDEVIPVSDDDAQQTAAQLAVVQGIFCGISSGAALWAAIQLAKRPENIGKNIVALLPDSGDRYLSTGIF